MERALQEFHPEGLDASAEVPIELRLTEELCRLSLHGYELEPLWLDYWSADFRKLQNDLRVLNISPSEMLHLVDPERLEEVVRYWEALDEEDCLERNKQRLLSPFQLRRHDEDIAAVSQDIATSRQNKAVIRRKLDELAEEDADPADSRIAQSRRLLDSLRLQETQMNELLNKGHLDIDAWDRQHREEFRFVSRRHAEDIKKLQELSNN